MPDRKQSPNQALKDRIDTVETLIDSYDSTPHPNQEGMEKLLAHREQLLKRLHANRQAVRKQHYINAWNAHIEQLQDLFLANMTKTDRREEWNRVRGELVQVVTEQADLTYQE